MKLIRFNKNTPKFTRPLALTIGNFDGVHLGHQAIIKQLISVAHEKNYASALLMFEPSPTEYFLGANAPARMTTLIERLPLLKKMALDYVIVMRFDAVLASQTPEQFIELLQQRLNMKYLLIGDDFRFGKNRLGDFALLEALAKKYGYQVAKIDTVRAHNERISSTRIRQALEEGSLAIAEQLLGRPYQITGRVEYGRALGRTLNFPTANIALKRHRAPLRGVYAVKVHGIPGITEAQGVANIGNRPTVDGTRSLLEVYLFDFNQDIYGKRLTVEFCHKIRDEQRFDSLDALKKQIAADVQTATHYFKEHE